MGVSFEDLEVGARKEIGAHTFTREEIVEFATRYDPQPFHVDEIAAHASPYCGLIASGWHTCSVLMSIFVHKMLEGSTSMGSPGVDEIRWVKPVRPGDTIHLFISVLDKRVLASRPDRGIASMLWEGVNQAGEIAVSVRSKVIFGLRGEEPGASGAPA
ncbi:MAG TPA: MaoC family dehydratase [Trinickia sp.]|jgi:acyl dehydratase|uniref:MaoC family dehydratase n=1 Tax=Trinickia sp. TaxID=2571163 RepID=UPI002F4208D1